MSRQIKSYVTREEYLALERKAEYKSEYLSGGIFAMTGASRKHYRTLDSLSEHLLVAQEEYRIEQYTRQVNEHWLLSETESLEGVVDLSSIGCSLALRDVYDKISLSSS